MTSNMNRKFKNTLHHSLLLTTMDDLYKIAERIKKMGVEQDPYDVENSGFVFLLYRKVKNSYNIN